MRPELRPWADPGTWANWVAHVVMQLGGNIVLHHQSNARHRDARGSAVPDSLLVGNP